VLCAMCYVLCAVCCVLCCVLCGGAKEEAPFTRWKRFQESTIILFMAIQFLGSSTSFLLSAKQVKEFLECSKHVFLDIRISMCHHPMPRRLESLDLHHMLIALNYNSNTLALSSLNDLLVESLHIWLRFQPIVTVRDGREEIGLISTNICELAASGTNDPFSVFVLSSIRTRFIHKRNSYTVETHIRSELMDNGKSHTRVS
jgi:hypothetical protein